MDPQYLTLKLFYIKKVDSSVAFLIRDISVITVLYECFLKIKIRNREENIIRNYQLKHDTK